MLESLLPHQRLFTYKVAHDAGSAPNPYDCICTLALCKPAIRRVAQPGDLIVGLGCGDDDARIVYAMVVAHSVSWPVYISACSYGEPKLDDVEPRALRRRIPSSASDPGDCIWRDGAKFVKAFDSLSLHGGPEDFQHDVTNGANVLIGRRFWYFGRGDSHVVRLPSGLRSIIPGRGHRSNSNKEFRNAFVSFFNSTLVNEDIVAPGKYGEPKDAPAIPDQAAAARCRATQREFDSYGEDE